MVQTAAKAKDSPRKRATGQHTTSQKRSQAVRNFLPCQTRDIYNSAPLNWSLY